MDTQNIFYRLKSGLALLAGVVGGRYLGLQFDESQYSAYFIGGFTLSYIASHFIFLQARLFFLKYRHRQSSGKPTEDIVKKKPPSA